MAGEGRGRAGRAGAGGAGPFANHPNLAPAAALRAPRCRSRWTSILIGFFLLTKPRVINRLFEWLTLLQMTLDECDGKGKCLVFPN